jgi:hypothetical protein
MIFAVVLIALTIFGLRTQNSFVLRLLSVVNVIGSVICMIYLAIFLVTFLTASRHEPFRSIPLWIAFAAAAGACVTVKAALSSWQISKIAADQRKKNSLRFFQAASIIIGNLVTAGALGAGMGYLRQYSEFLLSQLRNLGL